MSLMDFLKQISSNKIPWPNPTVKVESRFLDLYTDKDEACIFCKFSARKEIVIKHGEQVAQHVRRRRNKLTITGHRLGAVFALLSVYDIVEIDGLERVNGQQGGASAHVFVCESESRERVG
jgi:hypothetical protein